MNKELKGKGGIIMNNDEKKAHIEGINKSLKCLMDAGHWEDFREIIMKGIIKLVGRLREERKISLAEFEEVITNSDNLKEEEWRKEIDVIINLSNKKDDNENEFA